MVKDPAGFASYEGVRIEYKRGKPPFFIIIEDDEEVERIALSGMNKDEIRVMLGEKGFVQREVEATEVEATEVEATEVEATEVEATEVEATEL